jgi:hypothetical protein
MSTDDANEMRVLADDDVMAQRARIERSAPLTPTIIGHRRASLRKVPKPRGAFERWLDEEVPTGVWRTRIVRQSSTSRREYRKHFATSTMWAQSDPDVAAVRQLDIGDLLSGAVVGMPSFRIEKQHLSGGGRSRAFVGTAVVVGSTLFLFVLSSAAEDNLTSDHEDQDGNAFTTALQTVVRRLSFKAWLHDESSRLWVHFPKVSRLARDERHAVNLLGTLQWAMVILQIEHHTYDDLRSSQAGIVLGIFTSMAVQELEAIVDRLAGPKFALLSSGQWLGNEAPPIGYEFAEETIGDGRQTWVETDKHRLRPKRDAAVVMIQLVDEVLRSAGDDLERGRAGICRNPKAIPDWKQVTRFAGEKLGVQSRDWTHIERGGLAIHELKRGGAPSLRKYLEPRWVEGWRTGRTPFDLTVPRVIASQFKVELGEHQEWVTRQDGTVAVRSWIEMPLPDLHCEDRDRCDLDEHHDAAGQHLDHGFGIPDWKWDRLQELLIRTARRGGMHIHGRGHGPKARRHPLASVIEFDRGNMQFKLHASRSKKHQHVYQLYIRPAAPDPARAWTKGADELCLASMVAAGVNSRLGHDLEDVLRNLDRRILPLTAAPTAEAEEGTATTERARQQVETVEAARRTAAAHEKVARRAHLNAKAALDLLEEAGADLADLSEARADLAEAKEQFAEASAALQAAENAVARAHGQLRAAEQGEDQTRELRTSRADLTQHAVVAKALQKADGAVDPVLNTTLLELIDTARSRCDTYSDDHTRVTFTVVWQFVEADTSEEFSVERTFDVERLPPNTKGRLKHVDPKQRQHALPRLLLHDGLDRATVGRRFSVKFRPGKTNDQGFKIVRAWLAGNRLQVPAALHQSLIDAAPEVRKAIYLTLVEDEAGLVSHLASIGGDAAYGERLRERWTGPAIATRASWPATWAAASHHEDRTVVEALLARGGCATIGDLAADTQLTLDQVARTAHLVPRSHRHLSSPQFAQPPIVIKGEWRSRTIAPLAQRKLWLQPCPHDCTGYVTHPIWTPETDPPLHSKHQAAALCGTCRRTPWSTAVYPHIYLTNWSGPVDRSGGVDHRKVTRLMPGPLQRPATSATAA